MAKISKMQYIYSYGASGPRSIHSYDASGPRSFAKQAAHPYLKYEVSTSRVITPAKFTAQ